MSVYNFIAKGIKGNEISLEQYQGKVLLIVNTASECGFTPQYAQLQELYDRYKDEGLVVLGFPCNQFGGQEPGSEDEIVAFCEANYNITFPMFAKIDVNGSDAHPLFAHLAHEAPGILGIKAIKWNFTKFLIDRKGTVVERFAPNTEPSKIIPIIEKLLKL